ncbi:MAG: 3,4-dihydroxy-2-butanone-4-phosphate synthase [Candidatus Syntrophoarchaeum sp. WYZ-LMO15]|nr:MAG: 3,4-dihydroxy-2-butanone-4-phosphate synthase [Candidatus Syntrophoarchaeum sp. WYZ-LMO15]
MSYYTTRRIEDAKDALRMGKPILIYDFDDREGETDIVVPARYVTPADVFRMRHDGGGLICVAIHPEAADRLGLPFMADILRVFSACSDNNGGFDEITERIGDIPYDRKSSFSIWVNHRGTFTGITDNDRALTIRKLGEIVEEAMNGNKVRFGDEFRSPGHVAVLRAAKDLLFERVGQTELSVAMAMMAGITPAMAICEMLDHRTGKALSKEDAIEYGRMNKIPFLEGSEIIDAFME